MLSSTDERLTSKERRQQAREQARAKREREKKITRRKRFVIQLVIVIAVLALAAGIILAVLSGGAKESGPGPKNMASGGVTFIQGGVVEGPALDVDAEYVPAKFDGDKTQVVTFVDYMCPGCGNFEQMYGVMLAELVEAGDIELHIVPTTWQNPQSLGTDYSARAANLVGCVVEQQPEVGLAVHSALFDPATQPSQGTVGLTDNSLVEVAEAAGAEKTSELRRCVKGQMFSTYFNQVSDHLLTTGTDLLGENEALLGPDGEKRDPESPDSNTIISTPTVLVNGTQWDMQTEFQTYLFEQINGAER